MAKDGANMAWSYRFNRWARGNNPSGPGSGPREPHSPLHRTAPAGPTRPAHVNHVPSQSPPGAGTFPSRTSAPIPPRAPESGFFS
ncbi:hypothetical protein GCM10010345_24180 [Streptomyces canarius]|uniref:Uncharacterized protein n=1 Tax=Streptomyces canarius TaxID=285453 RepID=A0ABQ3CP14_9ACTN|nr:hypothetical protein GCM10010345_24180 [Streptomyces canarius]